MTDNLKITAALLVVVAGIAGFYYFGDTPEIVRWLGMLAALGVAAAVGYTTAGGKRFFEFAKDARQELRKVVWPTNRETVQVTLVVVALVVVVAVILWIVDFGLLKAVRYVTGQGA
jgi:preprotein translocase subunit SecE